jgi:DNA replication licensing factor MCM3
MIAFTELVPLVNEALDTGALFGSGEARAAVGRMSEANEVMFADDVVFKI